MLKMFFLNAANEVLLSVLYCRLVSAFSYYGIVLLTTELFETPDGCHGE